MEELLQKKFDGLEAALNKLLESITTYNPSIPAAQELLAADTDLNEGLELLAQHQANHKEILALQHTADQLDNQIKNTIRTIAETRKELLNAPFASFDDTSRDLPVEEILSYAKQIAPFTVPPTYASSATAEESQKPDGAPPMANGTATSPIAGTGENTGTQTPADTQHPQADSQDAGLNNIIGDLKSILDARKHVPFVPWPDENRIKASALMAVQHLWAPEDKSKQKEANDQKVKEEEQKRMGETDGGEPQRVEPTGESFVSTAPQTRKQEEFRGFALYDEDD